MKWGNLARMPGQNGKFILLLIAFMILAHLVVFGFYGHYSKISETKVNQDLVIRQIMSLIQTIRSTESTKRKKVADKVRLPNLKASIEETPKYTEQFQQATLWYIVQSMQSQGNHIQFSLQLEEDSWLNVSALIGTPSWRMPIILIILELAFTLAIIFYIWGLHKFTIPLKKFTKAAERLGLDLNTKPLQEYGSGIVRDTATAINRMQKRISDLIHERTLMLAAISHDLRTPITRLKLRSQFIEDERLQIKLLNDLDDMEAMVTETLHFARNDNLREKKVRLDLNALIRSVCTNQIDMGQAVSYRGTPQRIPFFGRQLALKRAFTNLIENAIKYGEQAEVTLTMDAKFITLYVCDQGPGIPENEYESVFAPFYRREDSRSRRTGGIGLGLAVTRDIIHAHEGTIRLEKNKPSGLKVIVQFKK